MKLAALIAVLLLSSPGRSLRDDCTDRCVSDYEADVSECARMYPAGNGSGAEPRACLSKASHDLDICRERCERLGCKVRL